MNVVRPLARGRQRSMRIKMFDKRSLVRQMYEAWNKKDLDRVESFAHADAMIANVAFGTSLRFGSYVRNWATAFPDGSIDVVDMFEGGDCLVAEFIGRGTHTGVLEGPSGPVAPTNRRIEVRMVEFGASVRAKSRADGCIRLRVVHVAARAASPPWASGAGEPARERLRLCSARPSGSLCCRMCLNTRS